MSAQVRKTATKLADGAEVANDSGAIFHRHGNRRHDGDVGGDTRAVDVTQPETQLCQFADPRLRNGDDCSHPFLAVKARRQEHGSPPFLQ